MVTENQLYLKLEFFIMIYFQRPNSFAIQMNETIKKGMTVEIESFYRKLFK